MLHRKMAIAGVVALMVLIIGLLVVPGLSANGNGADVVISTEDASCAVFVDDGVMPGFGSAIDANKTKLISTSSANGNKTFQCEVWGYGNDTGSAIVYVSHDYLNSAGDPAYNCTVTFNGLTDITNVWHQTISAEGDLNLTCQFNDNQF